MKFKDLVANSQLENIKQGIRAVKTVRMRLASVAPEPLDASPEAPDPAVVLIGLRVLTGAEIVEVYQKAQSALPEKAVWDENNPKCAMMIRVQTLALACVDLDSDPKCRTPFFESAEEILESMHVGPDNIAYLYECQLDWQEECGIQRRELSFAETLERIYRIVGGDLEDPLAELRPGLRASFIRTMASLCVTSLQDRLPGGAAAALSGIPTANGSIKPGLVPVAEA